MTLAESNPDHEHWPLELRIVNRCGFMVPEGVFDTDEGSRDCGRIRRNRAELLPGIIEQYAAAGDPVAPPNEELMALLLKVSGSKHIDKGGAVPDNQLLRETKTATYAIVRAHIEAFGKDPVAQEQIFLGAKRFIEDNCLHASKDFTEKLKKGTAPGGGQAM